MAEENSGQCLFPRQRVTTWNCAAAILCAFPGGEEEGGLPFLRQTVASDLYTHAGV
jgi:hypothetical protein